jgi:hypothetical protein
VLRLRLLLSTRPCAQAQDVDNHFQRIAGTSCSGAPYYQVSKQEYVVIPADTPSPPYGGWVSYGSGEAIVLTIVLAAVAGTFAYLGTRVRSPISVRRPGRTVSGFMIVIWALAIYTFVVAMRVYGGQLRQIDPGFTPPDVRVGTLYYAAVTFFVILYLTRRYGWRIALGSAFIGTAAAPMIFELPFDLIVMPMTYPPLPPNPALYRQIFFFPIFILEVSTISLLTLLPPMRITGSALYALAGMFAVFAVWAVFGFSFPGGLLPKTLNIISKILCFITAIMLFVWHESEFTTATTSSSRK